MSRKETAKARRWSLVGRDAGTLRRRLGRLSLVACLASFACSAEPSNTLQTLLVSLAGDAGIEAPVLVTRLSDDGRYQEAQKVFERQFATALTDVPNELSLLMINAAGDGGSVFLDAAQASSSDFDATKLGGAQDLRAEEVYGLSRHHEVLRLPRPLNAWRLRAFAEIVSADVLFDEVAVEIVERIWAALHAHAAKEGNAVGRHLPFEDANTAIFRDICVSCESGRVYREMSDQSRTSGVPWLLVIPKDLIQVLDQVKRTPHLEALSYDASVEPLRSLLFQIELLRPQAPVVIQEQRRQ